MPDQKIYISGMGCLTPFGAAVSDLAAALEGKTSALELQDLPAVCRLAKSPLGSIGDFSDMLAAYVKPNQRRKMSRLSRMTVVAAGLALKSAGLLQHTDDHTGITFGTAFGSTGQSETFFMDFLQHGSAMVNPGLFPETVPNAPAGQISIVFGLKGPSATICQQNLSGEIALLQARDMLAAGMARRMLVVSAEELCPALLKGFDALGLLKRPAEFTESGIKLSRRTALGEAAVAILIETADSLAERKGAPLAVLSDIAVRGGGVWPASYGAISDDLANAFARINSRHPIQVESVIAGGTFIDRVDRPHFAWLREHLAEKTDLLVPEFATGNVLGAGLLRIVTGILQLQGNNIATAPLVGHGLPETINLDTFYQQTSSSPSSVLTSALAAGGGAGMVLLSR